jgi:hypothetical protein
MTCPFSGNFSKVNDAALSENIKNCPFNPNAKKENSSAKLLDSTRLETKDYLVDDLSDDDDFNAGGCPMMNKSILIFNKS